MKVAIYARVCTANHGQDPTTQLLPLREYARQRGFEVLEEFVDAGISGAKERRPRLDQMMADVRKKRFDAVMVWRFDRFARSTKHLLTASEEFQRFGVQFISLTENVDTSTPMGTMVFTILGAVAQMERELIRDRVNAGVARARKQGIRLGRPSNAVDVAMIRDLYNGGRGLPIAQIARNAGVSRAKVRGILKETTV